MKEIVNNLINISLGLNSKATGLGGYLLVQAKDFSTEIGWNAVGMAAALEDLIRPQHKLKPGDVLLLCKGKSFKAKQWKLKEKAVASSSYFILRVTDDALLPEYLCWYLNTRAVQEYFLSQSSGTTVRSILKKTVAELEIPMCSKVEQIKLMEAYRLWEEEKLLREAYIEKKNTWLEQEMFQRINSCK